MIQKFKTEQIFNVPTNQIQNIISQLNLYCLSEIYKYCKNVMEISNVLNDEIYIDSSKETKEEKKYKEYINKKCMKNIHLCEIIIFNIENEMINRNINNRFFNKK